MPLPDASVDAVFDFEVLHHIPDWRAAVAEVARVLRPSGCCYFAEVTRRALDTWVMRTFTDHPPHDRFTGGELVDAFERWGIAVDARVLQRFLGCFILGVGIRR